MSQLISKKSIDSKHKDKLKTHSVKVASGKRKSEFRALHPSKIKALLGSVIPLAKACMAKRQAILLEKQQVDEKYVLVDVKGASVDPFAAKLKAVDEELAAIRRVALTALGTNMVRVPLIQSLLFASTVTTGVVNTPFGISAAALLDFATFAGIFEEYRFTGGEYEFVNVVSSANSITTPALTTVAMGSIGYSTLSAAATSVAQILDDEQSKLMKLPVIFGGADTMVPTGIQSLRFRVPGGVLDDTTVANASNWCLTSNTSAIYGYIRPYLTVASAAAVPNCVSGILKIHAEFKLRI